MRVAKILIVFLAIGSTVAFILASQARPRPTISSAAIQPAMNFAYVRLEGTLTDYPTLAEADGYLSFRLRDRGGEMRVQAYRVVVNELLRRKRIPMPGDQVTVEGTLRIRDDEASLTINDPAELRITAPIVRAIRLSELEAAAPGEVLGVNAQVRRIRDVGDSLRVVSLREGNITADMLLPLNSSAFGRPPDLRVGDWVSAEGSVGEFRGRKQLLALREASTQLLPVARAFELRPIATLGKEPPAQWFAVSGTVRDIRSTAQSTRIELQDDQGNTVPVQLFDLWHSLPFSPTLKVGDSLAAQGEWTETRNGRLELRPELPVDIQMIKDWGLISNP